jgi:hypothetical protein
MAKKKRITLDGTTGKPIKRTKSVKKMSILQLLHQKVDVANLLASVYIDEDKLYDSALEQPNLTILAGQFRVQRMHIRIKLETKLKLVRSRAALRFRKVKDGQGRKEFTEGAIKERVELDPNVRRLQRKLDRAIALEELSKNLAEVFRFTRNDALKIIVQAGKISLHAQELELLKGNKNLAKSVYKLRQDWRNRNEEESE